MLAALTKQVSYGPLEKCKRLPEIGYFDWFGNDRQKAWAGLGNMKKHHAMEELVILVDKCIPVFWYDFNFHKYMLKPFSALI